LPRWKAVGDRRPRRHTGYGRRLSHRTDRENGRSH
jgi:hypothetical protein